MKCYLYQNLVTSAYWKFKTKLNSIVVVLLFFRHTWDWEAALMGLCSCLSFHQKIEERPPGVYPTLNEGEKRVDSVLFFFCVSAGSCFVAVHWVLYCTPAVPPCRRWWPRLTRCNVWRTISYSIPIVLYLLAVLSLSLSPVSWLVCVGHRGLSAGIWYPDIKA